MSVLCFSQHTSADDGRSEAASRSVRSARCKTSLSSGGDESPHVGNYRLLKTIGKGNFAKVKLARHILTGREVRHSDTKRGSTFHLKTHNRSLYLLVFCVLWQVAIKIIDKTQLNPTSLQKVRKVWINVVCRFWGSGFSVCCSSNTGSEKFIQWALNASDNVPYTWTYQKHVGHVKSVSCFLVRNQTEDN